MAVVLETQTKSLTDGTWSRSAETGYRSDLHSELAKPSTRITVRDSEPHILHVIRCLDGVESEVPPMTIQTQLSTAEATINDRIITTAQIVEINPLTRIVIVPVTNEDATIVLRNRRKPLAKILNLSL